MIWQHKKYYIVFMFYCQTCHEYIKHDLATTHPKAHPASPKTAAFTAQWEQLELLSPSCTPFSKTCVTKQYQIEWGMRPNIGNIQI